MITCLYLTWCHDATCKSNSEGWRSGIVLIWRPELLISSLFDLSCLRNGLWPQRRVIPMTCSWQKCLFSMNVKALYRPLCLQDVSGMSLSMLAAAGGHDDILRLLIRKGVRVNNRQKNGTTALMHAAEKVREPHLFALSPSHLLN